jgi:flagellar assembly factor FliW
LQGEGRGEGGEQFAKEKTTYFNLQKLPSARRLWAEGGLLQGKSSIFHHGIPDAKSVSMNTSELTVLDPVDIQQQHIVHLPLGLLGFEHIKQYVLLTEPGQEPFQWLQVINDPSLAFVVISPFEVFPDYQPDLTEEDVDFLDLCSAADALIYNIVTIRPNGVSTVNLKGPIVLNRFTLRGKQLIPANAAHYGLRELLPIES